MKNMAYKKEYLQRMSEEIFEILLSKSREKLIKEVEKEGGIEIKTRFCFGSLKGEDLFDIHDPKTNRLYGCLYVTDLGIKGKSSFYFQPENKSSLPTLIDNAQIPQLTPNTQPTTIPKNTNLHQRKTNRRKKLSEKTLEEASYEKAISFRKSRVD